MKTIITGDTSPADAAERLIVYLRGFSDYAPALEAAETLCDDGELVALGTAHPFYQGAETLRQAGRLNVVTNGVSGKMMFFLTEAAPDAAQSGRRLRIPCAPPTPLSGGDKRNIAARFGGSFEQAADVFKKSLGPGAFMVCPSCEGGDTSAPYPFCGCYKCTGTGYQWAIENADGQGGWAVVDWSDEGEPLQGANRR